MSRWILSFLFLIALHSALPCAQAAELTFQTYGFNTGLAMNIHKSVREFMSQIEKDCALIIDYEIEPFFRIDALKDRQLMETKGSKNTVYEKDFLKLLRDHPALESKNAKTIRIIHLNTLENRCGFATPTVLLKDSVLDSKTQANFTNSLLVSDQLTSCGNFKRLISHELAHLLIQDDPPHACLIQGAQAPCPPNNILSDQTTQTQYFPTFGNRKPPSVKLGSDISADQCLKIKATLRALSAN